ncbi:hypothetical protein F5883DRAFT_536888 [Diaporthe sp. PMI_573]|nr:hypothetical protein F5883DRAFT_536888 [Diaporthaceae sp. PMI_573]
MCSLMRFFLCFDSVFFLVLLFVIEKNVDWAVVVVSPVILPVVCFLISGRCSL